MLIATRSVFLCGLIALGAPAFAASEPVTQTTRDQRMAEAMKDYQSGKPPDVVAAPAPTKSTSKTHHSAKK